MNIHQIPEHAPVRANHIDDPNGEESFQKKSLRDEVFELLHRRVIAGKYAPGEWLRQEDISQQLGVSQTPVREALYLLVASGLAERIPYRGVRVLQPTNSEILDAYTLRMELESLAVRLAVPQVTPQQIEALIYLVEQTRELTRLDDISTLRQLNREFHTRLVSYSGNSLLSKLYEMVANSFPDWLLYEYLFRHPELLPAILMQEYQEHKMIVEAIAARNAQDAIRHVITHISNIGNELETYLGITPETTNEDKSQGIQT